MLLPKHCSRRLLPASPEPRLSQSDFLAGPVRGRRSKLMNHRSFGKSGDPSMAKHAATGKICSVLPLADPADGVVQNSHEMSITCGQLKSSGARTAKSSGAQRIAHFCSGKNRFGSSPCESAHIGNFYRRKRVAWTESRWALRKPSKVLVADRRCLLSFSAE